MKKTPEEFLRELVKSIESCQRITGIGITGTIPERLVPGESDVDLFILCDSIPTEEERTAAYDRLGSYDSLSLSVCNGGHWGHGDIIEYSGIDMMPMYFTAEEMETYVEDTLAGKNLDKDERFYPTGRLASIGSIDILWEKNGAWTRLVDMVNTRPRDFFVRSYRHEIGLVIDVEDIARTLQRREVLFWHQTLETALDHLLMAIFALNGEYFPSRKRTLKLISDFRFLPKDCEKRLLEMIKLGADVDTIDRSVDYLKDLVCDVKALSEGVSGFEKDE